MRYRNKLNGAIIDVKSKLLGNGWELISPKPDAEPEKTETKKRKRA